MSTWSWAPSLIVALIAIGAVLALFGEVAHRFGPRDDHDWLADRKRRIERRGRINRYTRDTQ